MKFLRGFCFGDRVFFAVALALALYTVVPLAGCGNNSFDSLADKNSAAAKDAAAQISIDSGNNAAAVATLLQSSGITVSASGTVTLAAGQTIPAAKAAQLASAYMGQAGLNTLTLASNAADLANNNTTTTAAGGNGNFASIAKILPAMTASNLTSINNAILILQASDASKPSEERVASQAPTNCRSQKSCLQLGIAEVTASIIAISLATGGYDSKSGLPIICNGNCASVGSGTTITTSSGTSLSQLVLNGGTISIAGLACDATGVKGKSCTIQGLNSITLDGTTSVPPAPGNATPTLGYYVAYYLSDAATNLAYSTASSTGTNQMTDGIYKVIWSLQSYDPTAKAGTSTCSATAAPVNTSNATITQITNNSAISAFVANCLK